MRDSALLTDTLSPSAALKNFAPLASKDAVNAVYLGGSITQGAQVSMGSKSWVGRVSAMLARAFPNKTVRNYNAGIGGTGSDLGLLRLYDDVISRDPDIVFVEFAVNDQDMLAVEAQKQMEGIVRNLLQLPKQPVIVFVYTTTFELRAYDTVHSAVARHYGIPEINLQAYMSEKVNGVGSVLRGAYLGDGVHPNDNGYFTYAEYIISCLNQPGEYLKAAVWDETPLNPDYYQYTGQKLSATDGNIIKTGGWSTVDGAGTVTSSTANDTLTYAFYGPYIGIGNRIGNSYGDAEVYIDGELQTYLRDGQTYNYLKGYYSAVTSVNGQPVLHYKNLGLTDEPHTLTVKILGTKDAASSGTKFTVDYIYVKK
jgi:lysophospholipase L1-like esterase